MRSTMKTETIRDKSGNLRGYFQEESSGRLVLRDKSGNFRGSYDSKSGVTRDRTHNIVAQHGNQLGTLIDW